jgi:hypothetical protein
MNAVHQLDDGLRKTRIRENMCDAARKSLRFDLFPSFSRPGF